MQGSDSGIEAHYVEAQNYALVTEQAKQRNLIYQNYLEIVQRIFGAYLEFYGETMDYHKLKAHEKSIYVEEFKNFLRKFGEIVRDTAQYQTEYIDHTRDSMEDMLSGARDDIIQKVQAYAKPQKVYKVKCEELHELKRKVEKQFINLKSEVAEASGFYNVKGVNMKAKAISEQVAEIGQIDKELDKAKKQIRTNCDEFELELINFRKKLLINKYALLNKMSEQSKNFRNSIAQILLLLADCVNSKFQNFQNLLKNPKDDTISISQSKSKRKSEDIQTIVSNLVTSIQQYNHLIDEIASILRGFDTSFKRINTKVQQILETNKKYLLDNINACYSIDESPSREVTETLDLFEYYTVKIACISDRVYLATNKLSMLKQNVKKHADVTLSLIKTIPKNREENRYPQIDQVYNQISYDFVTEILCEVYQGFKETLTDLKNQFTQKFYKKKKIKMEDSMEISHIDETRIVPKKKPCKKQLWLWRDWRDRATFTTTNAPSLNLKQIELFLSSLKSEDQSKQVAKYECVFYGKKELKGILKVCQKSIEFIGLIGGSNIHLIVPYAHIESVTNKVKIIERVLFVKTQKGDLIFAKLEDIEKTQKLINQYMEKVAAQQGPPIIKKATIQLTPEQIDFLQKNRERLEKERPSNEGLIKIKSIFVDKVTVDQVYELVYSDNPFTLRGKQQPHFFSHSMKKAGNFNYVAGKYDKPGPEFYTRNPEVKFTNSPLFSTRVNQFDHPMPPIPFMPKHCHCKQMCKLYWVSQEYFDYQVTSLSSGAPYADTFEVKILHKISKEGTGVRIELAGALFFVKDTSMKGMLKSKGENEMIEGGIMTIDEMEKCLNIVSGNSAPEEVKEEAGEAGDSKVKDSAQPSNEMNKLKNQNKILILALVGVILVNVLLRFIMS